MPGFMRIGRSGYLLFVATYIIDVNAHCWPFIKTPPYIRSTPLEDFIPPCSRRARTLFPHSSRSLDSSSHSPPLLFFLLLHYYYYSSPTLVRVSLNLLFRRASHPFLWWKRTSPPLDASHRRGPFLFFSTPLSFLMPAPSLPPSLPASHLFFLSFHELIFSRELTHASSFRSDASGRSLIFFLTFLPRVNPLFPHTSRSLLLLLFRFPRRPGTTSSLL